MVRVVGGGRRKGKAHIFFISLTALQREGERRRGMKERKKDALAAEANSP